MTVVVACTDGPVLGMFYDHRSTLKKREKQCKGVKHCVWEKDGPSASIDSHIGIASTGVHLQTPGYSCSTPMDGRTDGRTGPAGGWAARGCAGRRGGLAGGWVGGTNGPMGGRTMHAHRYTAMQACTQACSHTHIHGHRHTQSHSCACTCTHALAPPPPLRMCTCAHARSPAGSRLGSPTDRDLCHAEGTSKAQCIDMCINTRTGRPIHGCICMCVNMCIDMCIDMC